MYNFSLFLHIGNLFSSSRGSFPALSAAAHAGGEAFNTTAHVWAPAGSGPRPGSVARALGAQIRASWLFF